MVGAASSHVLGSLNCIWLMRYQEGNRKKKNVIWKPEAMERESQDCNMQKKSLNLR